jgi:hypothetical protein
MYKIANKLLTRYGHALSAEITKYYYEPWKN